MTESACKYCGMPISSKFYTEKQCCHDCYIQNKPKIEQLEKELEEAKEALRTLMKFEYYADGDEDEDPTYYWQAIHQAEAIVGRYDPDKDEDHAE